jgi:hypothetical protein
MKQLYFFSILCASIFQSCGYLAGPGNFGEIQINLHFASDGNGAASSKMLSKENSPASPQAVDRVVVIVRENIESAADNRPFDREVVRKEFRLGNNRALQAVIEVPLQNSGVNFFDLQIQVFQGLALLYAGQNFIVFDEKVKRVAAEVQLQPVAFRLFIPESIQPTNNRLFTLTGQAQDTSVTEFEIIADSVNVRFPVQRGSAFANPVMLFGNTTLVRAIAYRGGEFYGEVSRQVTYTGGKADVLVALVWDQPIDLNLEIQNPLQQIISVSAIGDTVNGRLLLSDQDGYGPEVFEWRANSILQRGLFVVRVTRSRTNLSRPASGRVYVFLGEKQNLPIRRILRFNFGPQDTQLSIDNILIQ